MSLELKEGKGRKKKTTPDILKKKKNLIFSTNEIVGDKIVVFLILITKNKLVVTGSDGEI